MPKKLPEFQNFGEYLYYAYANLQMLHYALKADKSKVRPSAQRNRPYCALKTVGTGTCFKYTKRTVPFVYYLLKNIRYNLVM